MATLAIRTFFIFSIFVCAAFEFACQPSPQCSSTCLVYLSLFLNHPSIAQLTTKGSKKVAQGSKWLFHPFTLFPPCFAIAAGRLTIIDISNFEKAGTGKGIVRGVIYP